MPDDLRTITMQTLPDVIRLLNESSHGMSLEYHVDFFSFLSLQRYWNFSYKHSLIRYVESEPAALIIVCTDDSARDAYTFYWGALPKFRDRRISISLFDACCVRLHESGYEMLYGVTVPDRPTRRYRFIQAYPKFQLVDMGARGLLLPDPDPSFQVRPIDSAMLSQITLPQPQRFHWCQRTAFLTNIAPLVSFLGSFAGDDLTAYLAISTQASGTTILDLRSPDASLSAGRQLLHWLSQSCSPPFTATNVFDQSYSHELLRDAGFHVTRHFYLLTRDLRTTCEQDPMQPA